MTESERKGTLTPRQVKFIEYYTDIDSETYNNAFRSAVKAGYSTTYAKHYMQALPEKVSAILCESLGGEKMKEKVISKLVWIMDALENPELRLKMKLSTDNVIKAIELLGKWQRLFTDKAEATGGIMITGYLPGEVPFCPKCGFRIDTPVDPVERKKAKELEAPKNDTTDGQGGTPEPLPDDKKG